MPSMELFRERPVEEQEKVLPYDVPVVAVEAASPFGWHEFADDVVGLSRFGASAPAKALYEHFGFSGQAIADRARSVLERTRG